MHLLPIILGTLFPFLHTKRLSLVNRSTRSNTRLMVMWKGTKLGWLLEVTLKRRALTSMRPFLRLLNLPLSNVYCPFLSREAELFSSWMLTMHSSMVISIRRFIWKSLLVLKSLPLLPHFLLWFAGWESHFMAFAKLLDNGFQNCLKFCYLKAIFLVRMIIHSSPSIFLVLLWF